VSDYRAIAAVTATIADMLGAVLNDVSSANITIEPPDVAMRGKGSPGVNVFLYQVTVNTGYTNMDTPTRGSDGTLVARPRLALNLRYILTSYADGNDLLAHEMLASAMRTLHEHPVLTRDEIRSAIQSPHFPSSLKLSGSDLADDVELVKLSPLQLSIEELTKLWASFFQTNYRISTAYEATLVLIQSILQPQPSLPVAARQLNVATFNQPTIQSVDPQVLEYDPAATIVIRGVNLDGSQQTSVLIDGIPAPIQSISSTELKVGMPVGPPQLTAGVKGVQVVQGVTFGQGQPVHPGLESNVVAFTLVPKITTPTPVSVQHGHNLSVNFIPAVTQEQEVEFLIGNATMPIAQRPPGSPPVSTLSVLVPSTFPLGDSLLRLRVDGAESMLQIEQNPADVTWYLKYYLPRVKVT
jgi:hypothetical protein